MRRHLEAHNHMRIILPPKTPRKKNKPEKVAKINNLLIELVTSCSRPLTIVEDRPMQELLQMASGEDASFFSRYKTSNDIKAMAQKMKELITVVLRGKSVSLMIDTVSKYNKSFIGISVQFVSEGRVVVYSLGIKRMTSSHSGVYIAELVRNTLSEYGIDVKQVYSLTTDNASNMIKARKILQKMIDDANYINSLENCDDDDEDLDTQLLDALLTDDLDEFEVIASTSRQEPVSVKNNFKAALGDEIFEAPCVAHTLQLAVNDAIKNFEERTNLVATVRSINNKLRTTNFLNMIYERNLLAPIMMTNTRWNSCYLMVSHNWKF